MSAASVNTLGTQHSPLEDALPTFGTWLRRKSTTLTFPVLIALANLFFALIKQYGGTSLPHIFTQNSLLTSHILQALMIAVLFFSVPRTFSTVSEGHERARMAADDFRTAWLMTLLAWFALYMMFIVQSLPAVAEGAANIRPSWLLHTIQGTASCLSTIGFWKCFLVVSNPDDESDPLKWVGVIVLLVFADILAGVFGSPGMHFVVDLGIGALSGVAMAFFVGRLESRLLRPPRWLLMLLYSYAVLQFGYGFLDQPSMVHWQPAFFMAVLVLKVLLAVFVNWLIGTGNLVFYLLYMQQLNHDYREKRNTFLADVRRVESSL
jgi:hypothetical protein